MRRVVITGAGIVSCIGHDLATVTEALKQGRSGITFNESYAEHEFKSHVSGSIDHSQLDTSAIDRKLKRFFSDASLYAYVSALNAIEHAGLSLETINSNPRVGVVASSGGASTENIANAIDAMREKGLRGVGAMAVPKTMGSSVSAALATGLKIQGISYSLTSACATSTHCIGHAAELIQLGKADVILAGGSEAEHWTQSCMFDAMGAVSTQYNDTPELASRAYDKDRDGFVLGEGAGCIILEEYEHALKRGATIYAELKGGGMSADADHMTGPHPEGLGAYLVMKNCLEDEGLTADEVDHINMHGTSTPLGDLAESNAISKLFGEHATDIQINSTKSMTGHLLGAAGVVEAIAAIHTIIHNIVPPTINHFTDDEKIDSRLNFTFNHAVEKEVNVAMSNTFGFGGHNACVLFSKI